MDIWVVLRAVLASVLVLGLMYGLLRWLRRVRFGGRGGKLMKVLDVVSLGPMAIMCAVRVGDKVLVVGATEARVSLLCELEEVGEVPQDGEFKGVLRGTLERLREEG